MKKLKLKPLPSLIRWILWVLLVQFILINVSAALYAYKLTHFYTDPSVRQPARNRNILDKTWRLFSGPRQPKSVIREQPSFPYDTLVFTTKNGTRIDAWYARPDSMAKGTVILFHGITANKGMMLAEAGEFRFQGYNVLLVDFRAHGNSDGKTSTLGVREAEEVKLAYDHVQRSGEKNIFLWGSSMGAVVIAKAISDDDLSPAGVILEMPFASLQTHLQARARALGFPGFPEKPFGFFVTCWIGIERGFNGFKHSTPRYVANLRCPILLQWGARDLYVPQKETDKIYETIPAGKKKMVIYDQAGHESLLMQDPGKWRAEVGAFLNNYNQPH